MLLWYSWLIVREMPSAHAFFASETPIYQTGCKVILACASAQEALEISLRVLLMCRNKRRDQAAMKDGIGGLPEQDELADLTDFEVSCPQTKSLNMLLTIGRTQTSDISFKVLKLDRPNLIIESLLYIVASPQYRTVFPSAFRLFACIKSDTIWNGSGTPSLFGIRLQILNRSKPFRRHAL